MTAPPSTAYEIIDVPDPFRNLIARHGVPGTFVGSSEQESPWVPFGAGAAIRHLAFDVRNNRFSNVLWIKSPGVVAIAAGTPTARRRQRCPSPPIETDIPWGNQHDSQKRRRINRSACGDVSTVAVPN
jgi:hypothetical protein